MAAGLLSRRDVRLILPLRKMAAQPRILDRLHRNLGKIEGERGVSDLQENSTEFVPLESSGTLENLEELCRRERVSEIVHCAGCVDYFDEQELDKANVRYTENLLQLGRRIGVERIVFLSSAFSSGYAQDDIPETIHSSSQEDPTVYTESKRSAEKLIADGGLPFLILRPSIVIGDSRDGSYDGRSYGLYQLWRAAEKILCTEWHAELHMVAGSHKVPLIHQDHFLTSFLAAYEKLPPNSICNIVSEHSALPTNHELWDMWLEKVFRPDVTHNYETLEEVPIREIPKRQRAFISLASVNIEISNFNWNFETTNLDVLSREGLEKPRATLESVGLCQRTFIQNSAKVQEFLKNFGNRSEAATAAV